MLLRFEVSNYKSIDGPAELLPIAVDKDRPAARSFDRINEKVLTVAGIYGPNASGKSNLLEAIAWLANAVGTSLRYWEPGSVPREPFRFGDGPSRPTTIEIDLMVNEIRYNYVLEVDDTRVLYERLSGYPKKRARLYFERDEDDLKLGETITNKGAIRELTTPNTLLLSAAARQSTPIVASVAGAIANYSSIGGKPASTARAVIDMIWAEGRTERILKDHQHLTPRPWLGSEITIAEAALGLLKFADSGITNAEVVHRDGEIGIPRQEVQLTHSSDAGPAVFGLEEESEGTQSWFKLIGPVLDALSQGNVLLLDEIDKSLHPRLSARLVELFQDPSTNPRGAQLIFTTHDTTLLQTLSRDEVWFTEKSTSGATSLVALAEYGGDRVRQSTNLEKAYLNGRFGAVPDVDQALLQDALGLGQPTSASKT